MILRLVVFACGAGILAFEMVGLRIGAIYFGNAFFVVGNVIGVFLTALALGYWIGGVVADRAPRPLILALLIFTGGALLAAVPALYPSLLTYLAWDTGLDPRLSSLLGSAVLFLLPTVLLATVSPFAIRLAARTLAGVGTTSGQIIALSTVGSLLGLWATTLVLIPYYGLDTILFLLAAALVLTAVVCAALEPAYRRPAVSVAVIVLALLATSPVAARAERGTESIQLGEIIYQKDSQYHRITVYDWVGYRYLRFDRSLQSGIVLKDPLKSAFAYTDYVMLAWTYNPAIKRVLMLGLGGGTVARQIHKYFPDARIDIVEIDPEVVVVAKQFFFFTEDDRMHVFVRDARQFLARHPERKYDLIIQDAYYADSLPFHLATQEFFTLVNERLKPGGVFFNNIVSGLKGERSKIFRSIYKTMVSVFGEVEVYPVWTQWYGDEARNNIEVITLKDPGRVPTEQERLDRARNLVSVVGNRELPRLAAALYTEPIATVDVPILTDRYAPTDALIHLW